MKNFHFLALAAAVAALFSACEKPIKGVHLDKSSLSFTAEGGSQSIEVAAGTAWSVTTSEEDSWCTVSPKSGSASATLTVTVTPNVMKDAGRNTKFYVTYEDQSIAVDVAQEKNAGEPVFSLSQNAFEVPAEGGEISFTVISDAADYDVETVDWITEVSREGDRYTGQKLTFSVDGNSGKKERAGVISVCTKNGSCYPVSITQGAFEGKLFAHLNTAFRFTAVWCGHCPYMDETFKTVKASRSDFDYITVHASAGYPLYYSDANALTKAYVIEGFPTGIVNGWKEFGNSHDVASNAKKLSNVLNDFNKKTLCVAGVSVSSTVADGKVNVTAKVESSLNGSHFISAFLLESGIVETQTYFPDEGGSKELEDFVHDNVVRAKFTQSSVGDPFNAVAGKQETFSWSLPIDASWNAKNLSVVVLVHRPYADLKKENKKYPDFYVVNAAVAPAGGSFEMKYAE